MNQESTRNAQAGRTALDILTSCAPLNPGKRFAVNERGTCIGVWSDSQQRYVCVASLTITGEWCHLDYEPGIKGVSPAELYGEWIPYAA